MAAEQPLIVIVGPTASGKTALAIELAEKYNGEIVCADSRTIYKGMDIGTAKPTLDERNRVVHWGLDLVEPNERFSAAQFKQYALEKIADIRSRGKVPFLVGGSGLYVDAVVFDYEFASSANEEMRQKLEAMTLEELHDYCSNNNIKLPENSLNKRYVIRVIERNGQSLQRRQRPLSTSIIVGIATDRDELRTRIASRAEQILDAGVVEEAIVLGKKYGWDSEAMTGNIYRLIRQYVQGDLSDDELYEKSATLDWRLAKRQLTWFRRNEHIVWLSLDNARIQLELTLASR